MHSGIWFCKLKTSTTFWNLDSSLGTFECLPYVKQSSKKQFLLNQGNDSFKLVSKENKRKWSQHIGASDIPCICLPPKNKTSASTLSIYSKCFCGSCGIQHHITRNLGGGLPPCVLGNGQTDLSHSCGTCSDSGTGTSPSQPESRSPWKTLVDNHLWTREPFQKFRFPEGKSQHIAGAKTYKFGHTGVGKRNGLTLSASPLPWGSTAYGQERSLSPWFLLQRKRRVCAWAPGFPAGAGYCQRSSFLSHSIQSTKL